MSNNEKQMKLIVPCEVAIKRFYRMYVEVWDGASESDVKAKAIKMLTDTRDPDRELTEGDLYNEIEEQDFCEFEADWDASWSDDADEPGENDAETGASKSAEREIEMRRIARSAMDMLRLARPERKLTIAYIRPNERDIERYTEWQRKRNHIHTHGEYFLVWDCAPDWDTDKPDLLYAVDVSADSLLTAGYELMELLHRKF